MSQRKEMLMKNIEYIGFDDLNGRPGFQMAMYKTPEEKYYIYTASFRHNGWNIIDVTDPAAPRNVKWLEGPNPYGNEAASTPKIQIADGLMITAHGGTMKELHGTEPGMPFWGGITVWSLEDPENPQELGKFECRGGAGVHRFCYPGGRYVYVTGNAENFNGFILRIVDIKDPSAPQEVGRWWADEQFMKKGSRNEAAREFLNITRECILKRG